MTVPLFTQHQLEIQAALSVFQMRNTLPKHENCLALNQGPTMAVSSVTDAPMRALCAEGQTRPRERKEGISVCVT